MPKRHWEEGSALIFTIVILAIVLIMGAFLSNSIQHESRMVGDIGWDKKARNIAEAGVERAISELKTNPAFTGFTQPFGDGEYRVNVTYNAVENNYRIISEGRSPAINPVAVKTIETTVFFPVAIDEMSYALIADRDGDGDGYAITITSTSLVDLEALGDLLGSLLGGLLGLGGLLDDILGTLTQQNITIHGNIHGNEGVKLAQETTPLGGLLNAVVEIILGAHDPAPDIFGTVGAVDKAKINVEDLDESKKVEKKVQFPVFDFDLAKQEAIKNGRYYSGNRTELPPLDPSTPNEKKLIYIDGNLDTNGRDLLDKILDDAYGWTVVVDGTLTVDGDGGEVEKDGRANIIVRKDIFHSDSYLGLRFFGVLFSQEGKIDADYCNFQVRGLVGAREGIRITGKILQSLTGDMEFTYDESVKDLFPDGVRFLDHVKSSWKEM